MSKRQIEIYMQRIKITRLSAKWIEIFFFEKNHGKNIKLKNKS